MSVGATFEYQLLPFAAENVPGNPGGLWAINGEVEGDASGGTRSLTHLFQVLPGISNSNFYSIEAMDMSDTDLTSIVCVVQANSMGAIFPGQQTAALNQRFRRIILTSVAAIGGPQVTLPNWERHLVTPWFLGQASRNPSLAGLLVATVQNTDGEAFRCRLEGYWWPPGAMNAVGGLKRPLGSLYGK